MSLEERIQSLLIEFEKNIPDIVATSIVKYDGFTIADTAKKGFDTKKYAAMTAGLYGISNRTMNTIDGGNLLQTYVKGEKTEIICIAVPTKKIFIAVVTNKDPNIGLIMYQSEKLANDLKEVL